MPKSNNKGLHVGCSELGVAASLIYAGFNIRDIIKNKEHNCFVFEDTPASRLVVGEHLENELIVPSLNYYDIVAMLAIQDLEMQKGQDS